MDSKVKERIVGAIVLVALGVWLIPWVLDGTRETAPESEPATGLELPADQVRAPVRTETVELDAPAPSAAVAASDVAPSGATDATSATDASPDAAGAKAGSETTRTARSDASASGTRGAAGAAAPTATATPAAQEQASQSASSADAPAGWSVQVGSFGELANARQLASRVADYGYQAQVSEFRMGGRTMHRVRVGGFDSRDEAEDAASSLSANGFRPRVFPPE